MARSPAPAFVEIRAESQAAKTRWQGHPLGQNPFQNSSFEDSTARSLAPGFGFEDSMAKSPALGFG